jgi:hypothetical protein
LWAWGDNRYYQLGSGATAPANPIREGYTFSGWDKSFSCVTNDMTITALYKSVTPTATASVEKINGNQNRLTITVTEKLPDGTTNIITEVFIISNNATSIYNVGSYKVYVVTKGNDQVIECYII